MSSIVTFYSYKGGVGRSMALANIAFELARMGKKVLMVDWDLEAPGLEKYFSNYSIDNSGAGLLPMLFDVDNETLPDYNQYLWFVHIDSLIKISFLHSGREKDPNNYSSKLENFDWNDFFIQQGGGVFLEKLRSQWRKNYDIVLIDSRTGLSDSSGICTILLPDIIIPMFTANNQSLYGVRDIMRYVQSARQKLANDRMALTILPVPTRFGTRVEFVESQKWLDLFSEALKEFYSDWLPKWIDAKYVLEQIKIPQIDYFSFGERLAVAEQGTSDPEGMGFVYAKIASLLSSDFEDLVSFIGQSFYESKKKEYQQKKEEEDLKLKASVEFDYDVFISHTHDSMTVHWLKEFLPVFKEYLEEELGHTSKIFVDDTEIYSGDTWVETVIKSLQKSRILLAIVSPDYFFNKNNLFEWNIFLEKETVQKKPILFPIILKNSDVSLHDSFIKGKLLTDFSTYNNVEELKKSTKLKVRFAQEIEKLAISVANSISHKSSADEKIKIPANTIDVMQQVRLLANEYEGLRRILEAGPTRTRQMELITQKMKNMAKSIVPLLPELTNSDSPGEKLAAIASLQVEPDPVYLDWLANHIGAKEKPFIGYQASVGLLIASRSFGEKYKNQIHTAIDKAILNIEKSEYKDPNQVSVLNTAKIEMGYK
jgi:cellulose biosynthesis protein BcsQ